MICIQLPNKYPALYSLNFHSPHWPFKPSEAILQIFSIFVLFGSHYDKEMFPFKSTYVHSFIQPE